MVTIVQSCHVGGELLVTWQLGETRGANGGTLQARRISVRVLFKGIQLKKRLSLKALCERSLGNPLRKGLFSVLSLEWKSPSEALRQQLALATALRSSSVDLDLAASNETGEFEIAARLSFHCSFRAK